MNDYSRWLSDGGYAVFLFHGVIPRRRHQVRNYTRKHLPVDEFVAVLRNLCASGSPISMHDVVSADRGNASLRKRAFAVTFDDGFENNYSVAAPILDELRVPATFYVTTRFIESNAPSWIDRIESAIERGERVSLRLPAIGLQGTWETADEKIRLLTEIRQTVKNNRAVQPDELALDVCRQLHVGRFEPDPDLDNKMNWDQLQRLGRNSLFTVGGHSHTHRILEHLEQPELEGEVETSLEMLRDHLGRAVEHYSYPEGLAWCYSDRVIALLKRHGIQCAPTAEPGVNRVGDDLFRLKRIPVT